MALQEAANRTRLWAWATQPASFLSAPAVIDADTTIVPTGAEAKKDIDIAYNGTWGYAAFIVSLANTAEPLYFALHGPNRPSHEGWSPSMTGPRSCGNIGRGQVPPDVIILTSDEQLLNFGTFGDPPAG